MTKNGLLYNPSIIVEFYTRVASASHVDNVDVLFRGTLVGFYAKGEVSILQLLAVMLSASLGGFSRLHT